MSQPEQSSLLRLFLLGPPRLEADGATLPISTRKAMALLAYLAVTGQGQAPVGPGCRPWHGGLSAAKQRSSIADTKS